MADERQAGCDPTLMNRIVSRAALEQKYNLEMVAGSFLFTTFTDATKDILCYYTKCIGAPFPFPAPGINDATSCQ